MTPELAVRIFPADSPDCATFAPSALPVRRLEIADGPRRLQVLVEVADSEQERSRGLMCRSRVEPDTGMVFEWQAPVSGGFWMFNTYVPLDLLYVSGEGKVVAVRTMAPCPRNAAEEQAAWTQRCASEAPPYAPGVEYLRAVELPAGWLAAQGFDLASKSGWLVELK